VALKVRLDGLTVNVGVGAETVNVTGIDCGELVAPDPVTVIEAEYVAAESPATLAVTVKDPGAAPEIGDIDSHEAVLDALQLNVPVPVLLMFTTCAAGLLPPWVAEKARLVGTRLIVCGAVSVRFTMTVFGVLVAPVAEIVMGVE
jgi:hypothetical protein